MKRVVVTGMGALTPIGNNLEDFWSNLKAGKSGAGPITKFDASKFKTRFACEIKNFDITKFLDRKELRRYDIFAQYALVTANEAIAHAQLNFSELNTNKIGVIWGSGNGGVKTFEDNVTEYIQGDGTPRFNPYLIPKMIVDIAAGVISIKHGLRGVNYCPVSACASSTTAIIDAFNYIKWGKANVIIAGGSDMAITPSCIGGFNAAKALSTNNDEMMTASRPFDETRDGFVMGEGAGALVLEEYEHAIARGATIIGEIAGGGMAADAYHLTGSHPEGDGAFLGMEEALIDSGIKAKELDYLNLHATSTPIGDDSELKAVERLFGSCENLTMSATKSMTGHLLGATGAIEAIACVKACQEDIIPPTINTSKPDNSIVKQHDIVIGSAKQKVVNYAMSNTFGFGGHIATLVVKKFIK
jgi:3-oxoacyl-[acyl-carrier-protein] synthase II